MSPANIIGLVERNQWSVQYNSRIQEWTVQRHGQVCGCIGRGKTLTAAVDEAAKLQSEESVNRLTEARP